MASASNEVRSAIENGTFNLYIDMFKTRVFMKDVNTYVLKNIAWLSAVVFDKDWRQRVKSQDVIKAVTIFCERLNKLQGDNLISNYLTNMRVLLDYFKTAKDKSAVSKLAELMTISRHPLTAITSDGQIKLYWEYLKSLLTGELEYSNEFAENVVLSAIQFVKFQENHFTDASYVQNVCKMILFVAAKFLVLCEQNPETFCNFICSVFATLKDCKLKASVLSRKSYESLLTCLILQAEQCLREKLLLSKLLISSKSLQSIETERSNAYFWNLIYLFYTGITKSSLSTFLISLEHLDTKYELAILVLTNIFKALQAHSNLMDYNKVEIAHVEQIMEVYRIIIKKFQNVPNSTCAYCSNELHIICQIHSQIVNIHLKLLEKQNPKDSLVSSYKSFYETVRATWINNCPEKLNHSKLMFSNYIRLTGLFSKNNCIDAIDKILLLEQFLKNYTHIYSMAKEDSLLADFNKHVSQSHLSMAFNLLVELYLSTKQLKKAMFASCIGVHFANTSFRRYFNIKFENNECKPISSYDILTSSSLMAGYALSMDNNDFLKLLLMEIEASYKIWPSFASMLSATRSIFKLSKDPINLAKACVLVPVPKTADDGFATLVSKAIDSLVPSMGDYRKSDLIIASILLASLHYLKYSDEIVIYKKEISQGNSILSSAPEVLDRDGLVNANDTCNINPTAAKLNIKAEVSIMAHLMKAYDLWKFVSTNIGKFDSQNCYLEQTLYHMEMSALHFAERGYESLKIDLLILVYQFSVYLKKDMSIIKCMARLLTSVSQNDEIEPMVKTTNTLVFALLDDMEKQDLLTKIAVCDYLLSYSEYLWNSNAYNEGFIIFRYARYVIGDGSISHLLLARLHWVESLYRRSYLPKGEVIKHEATESVCFDLVSAFTAMEECWRINTPDMYYYLCSLGFFHKLVRLMGQYFLHIYQNRLAIFYLRMALKFSEKHAYAYHIGEILCILSRIDLRNQKTDQCQVKIMGLMDILYPSESLHKYSSQFVCEEKLVNIKQVRNPRNQVLADNIRDGSLIVPSTNTKKLTRLASTGSPALCQLVHKLPEFFNHQKSCQCINCQNASFYRLFLEAINIQANLNSYMGNMNIADEYFKNCKRVLNILSEKQLITPENARYSSNVNLKVYFQISSATYIHDYSIHLNRCQKHSQAMEAINKSISIYKNVSKFDAALYQDILSLKQCYLYITYWKNMSPLTLSVKDESKSNLTPLKVQNALAFKTPACGKVVPKIQPKFIIHEDFSPIAVTGSRIKFVLCDSDDEDQKPSGKPKINKSRNSTKSSDSDKSIYQTPRVKKTPKQTKTGKICLSVKAKAKVENKKTNYCDAVFVSPEFSEKLKYNVKKLADEEEEDDDDDDDIFYTPQKDNSVIACGGMTNSVIKKVQKLSINDNNNGKTDLKECATRNKIAKNIDAVVKNGTAALRNKEKDNVKKTKTALNFNQSFINILSPNMETQIDVHKKDTDVFYTPMQYRITKAFENTKSRQRQVQNLNNNAENSVKSSINNLKQNIKIEADAAKIESNAAKIVNSIKMETAKGINVNVSITSNEIIESSITSNEVIESSVSASPPKTVRRVTRNTRGVLKEPQKLNTLKQLDDNDKPEKNPKKNDLEIKPKTRTGRKAKNPSIL